MDPVTLIIVPAFLGGLAIALLLIRLQRTRRTGAADALADESVSTDVINAGRIRVAGVGGLGLLAMALTVAWVIPRIGVTLAAGFVLGAICAVTLVLRRRRSGALPSSGRRGGANAILSIDRPLCSEDEKTDASLERRGRSLPAVPASASRPA